MTAYKQLTPAEYSGLNGLWQQCFGDTAQEVAVFWCAVDGHVRVFAALDGEKAVSMLCALPVTLVDEAGDTLPAAYLYAICTAPERRGRGICAGLMAYAEDCLKKDGVRFSTLVPSGAELFGFYQKLGYKTAFFNRSYFVPAERGHAKITKLNAAGYRNLRQMQLYGAFLSYPLPLLQWQADAGAGLFRVETDEAVCCAAAELSDGRLICKELLPDCPEAAARLAAHLGCRDALVRTDGGETPFGMVKPLGDVAAPQVAYLGLAFD